MNHGYIRATDLIVDEDEGRFVLIVHSTEDDPITVDFHPIALEFYREVEDKMGGWVAEAESARAMVRAGLGPNGEQHDDGGYAPDDPKHPTYHDRMV